MGPLYDWQSGQSGTVLPDYDSCLEEILSLRLTKHGREHTVVDVLCRHRQSCVGTIAATVDAQADKARTQPGTSPSD